MAKNYQGKILLESEKNRQPCVPIEVAPNVFMTRNAVWNTAKDVIKTHPRMNGSGHMLQTDPNQRFPAPDLKEMIQFVKDGLRKQGINPDKCRIEPLVQSCMPKLIGRLDYPYKPDYSEKAKRKKRLEKERKMLASKPYKPEQTTAEPATNKTPYPTLSLNKRGQETRTVTVTVKKSRNFHYPTAACGDGKE